MIRNKRHRRIGAEKALLSRLGSQQWRIVSGTTARRFSKRHSSENINAIPVKVLAFTTDHGLIAAGVAAAISSAAFATFMICQNSRPDMLKGAEYPGIFAPALRARSHQLKLQANNPDGRPINNRTIDYNVTGSISMGGIGRAAQNTPPASNIDGSAASGGASTNNSYVLRFVHKEAALLQSDRGFYVARRGTMLPGAGKVLSIEKLGDTWILLTAARTFTEIRNNFR
jgi:hypothetical protein